MLKTVAEEESSKENSSQHTLSKNKANAISKTPKAGAVGAAEAAAARVAALDAGSSSKMSGMSATEDETKSKPMPDGAKLERMWQIFTF